MKLDRLLALTLALGAALACNLGGLLDRGATASPPATAATSVSAAASPTSPPAVGTLPPLSPP